MDEAESLEIFLDVGGLQVDAGPLFVGYVVVRAWAQRPASAWCAMALVAKESILVIILPWEMLEFAALCASAGQVLAFAGPGGTCHCR